MSEKLCFKWDEFQVNTNFAFGSLRNDTDFSDVTLACEEGYQVNAHKVILAASGSFFQNLLRKNKHPHPIIYMRGVKEEDLVAILDFLYFGETNVYQENLDTFLAIADELQLKGLSRNTSNELEDASSIANEVTSKLPKSKKKTKVPKPQIEEFSFLTPVKEEAKCNTEVTEDAVDTAFSRVKITDIKELDEKVKSMMTKSQNTIPNGSHLFTKADVCTVCGKEGKRYNIRDHIEANHLEGVSIPCNFCEKRVRSRNALRFHTKKHHFNLMKTNFMQVMQDR